MIVEIEPAIYLTCLHFVLSFHLIPFNTETILSKPDNARKQLKHVLADVFGKCLTSFRGLAIYATYKIRQIIHHHLLLYLWISMNTFHCNGFHPTP